MPASASQPDPYAPGRSPDYRRYAGSWFLIVFSRQIEVVAIGYYLAKIFSADKAAFLLGILGLVQALPVMLLAIAGGQLADRYNRWLIMTLGYSLGILSAAGLLATALLHGPILWIYVCLGLAAVGWALGNPSRQAMLPSLVPTEIFSNAVAWNSTAFYSATVTGPLVGGAIMSMCEYAGLGLSGGLVAVFRLVLLCRIGAVAAISLIRYRRTDQPGQAISWQSVLAGIRFVWRTKPILATITLDLFAVLLGGATYLLPIYAEKILHVGGVGLGCLRAADAVGAICMATLLAHLPPIRRAGMTLLWAVAGFGLATAVFGWSTTFWLSLVALFFVGVLDNISVVIRHTLVQMLTPDEMRGRVSAVNGVFIVASNDLGGLESGLTAWLFGPVISVVGGGIGAIVVVLGVASFWPQLRRIGSLDSLEPASPAETDREA